MKKAISLIFDKKARERFEHPERFCTYCGHHGEFHNKYNVLCHECYRMPLEKTDAIAQHHFNTRPSQFFERLKVIFGRAKFDEDTKHYYIIVARLNLLFPIHLVEKEYNCPFISATGSSNSITLCFAKELQ